MAAIHYLLLPSPAPLPSLARPSTPPYTPPPPAHRPTCPPAHRPTVPPAHRPTCPPHVNGDAQSAGHVAAHVGPGPRGARRGAGWRRPQGVPQRGSRIHVPTGRRPGGQPHVVLVSLAAQGATGGGPRVHVAPRGGPRIRPQALLLPLAAQGTHERLGQRGRGGGARSGGHCCRYCRREERRGPGGAACYSRHSRPAGQGDLAGAAVRGPRICLGERRGLGGATRGLSGGGGRRSRVCIGSIGIGSGCVSGECTRG